MTRHSPLSARTNDVGCEMKSLQILCVLAVTVAMAQAATFYAEAEAEDCADPDPLLGCPLSFCEMNVNGNIIKSNIGDGPKFIDGLGPKKGLCLHCGECDAQYGMGCEMGPTKRLRSNGKC